MQKKHVLSAALAVASLTSVAFAGTKPIVLPEVPLTPVTAPASQKIFSGDLSVGYSSNYDFRGLILNSTDGENMTPIKLDTRTKLTEKMALYAGLNYKAIWDKELLQDNEFNVNLGLDTQCAKGLTTRLGYDLYQGGLPGAISKFWRDNHSVTQEFMTGLQYDFDAVGLKGVFVGANAHYSFAGVTGWWFDATVGYKKQVSEKFAAVLSGTWWSTASYFDAQMPWMANGSQSFALKLELPYQLCKGVTFTPFVSTVWSGDGALKAKGMGPEGTSLYRNFTLVAGAGLTYSF